MFLIAATKSLNDGTRGFRFNFLGQKGLVRFRKRKNNGYNVQHKDCMTRINLGKATLYLEHDFTKRVLRHFAG